MNYQSIYCHSAVRLEGLLTDSLVTEDISRSSGSGQWLESRQTLIIDLKSSIVVKLM